MKIAFVSSNFNNHILPLCDGLSSKCEFFFILINNNPSNQFDSYNREKIERDYVFNYYDEKNREFINKIIQEADAVIFGGGADAILQERKRTGKLCFVYSERLFKKGAYRRFIPSIKRVYKSRFSSPYDNLYVLSASSFLTHDLKLLGERYDRCLKLGYIPFNKKIEEVKEKSAEKLKLLYVGRLIKLKRVKDVIKACKLLDKGGVAYELNIIGDGEQRKFLEKLAKNNNNIKFLGKKDILTVFEYMCNASALIFSSNKMEGWGAVVNEAMAVGTPVICSNTVGSAKFMIIEGENGFVYKMGNVKNLAENIKKLTDKKLLEKLSINAKNTIDKVWNGEIASSRLIKVIEHILDGKDATNLYKDGPLSKA